jgi:hypothetical protein
MFEEGNLLLFRPFIFKNGATPKDKFFLVLGKDIQGGLLLASLPTSKDHVPSDVSLYKSPNLPEHTGWGNIRVNNIQGRENQTKTPGKWGKKRLRIFP